MWCGIGSGFEGRVLIWTLQYHNESVLKKYGLKLKVGTVMEEAKL